MDNLLSNVITGVTTFGIGYALKYLGPKSRLVWWSPHRFLFNLQNPKVNILTHAITIQNLGRKAALNVEVVHKTKPDFFKLEPALDYAEDFTPAQEHVVRVESLAPKEFFSIEFLSHVTLPELLYIKSDDGHAQFITIQPQQILPRWKLLVLQLLLLVGLGFCAYWLTRALVFIWSHF